MKRRARLTEIHGRRFADAGFRSGGRQGCLGNDGKQIRRGRLGKDIGLARNDVLQAP